MLACLEGARDNERPVFMHDICMYFVDIIIFDRLQLWDGIGGTDSGISYGPDRVATEELHA